MIKLLALDLDGTLLNSSGVIPAENKAAIRAAEERGVLVTIATGRRFRDALPVALEAELNAEIISHNGALVKHPETFVNASVDLIGTELAREIIAIGHEFDVDPMISCDPHGKGTLLYERVSDKNIPLQQYINWAKRMHGAEASEAVHHVKSLNESVAETDVIHISYSGSCAQMLRLEDILKDRLGDRVELTPTRYPRLDFTLLDILPANTSKASAVRKLAEYHGITKDEVAAVGDNHNDLPMLEYAGTGVLMGNAEPSLLERTEFYTTLTNDENGVAAAINKFILGEI